MKALVFLIEVLIGFLIALGFGFLFTRDVLKSIFRKPDMWVYGTCNGRPARKHRINGNVQFVLWRAGEQGHEEDYWHNFDPSWWHGFKPNEN